MDPILQRANKQLHNDFIEKTRKEIRNNIARRERVAYGNGIIWAVIVTWMAMAMTYALGNTPNPGIMIVTFIYGLWNRYGKGN